MDETHRLRKTPLVVTAVMLSIALIELPTGYYHLLRLIVCGVSVYVAIVAHYKQKDWASWLFGFVAVLFNPFHPVLLPRDIWLPIDLICAVLFITAMLVLKGPQVQDS